MALARNLADLPTPARSTDGGCAPDPSPTFLRPFFDAMRARHEAEGERPHAIEGTRFRHSMAASCSRAVAYYALGVEKSNPMDLTGMVVTGNGTSKHDEIQAVLVEALGDDLAIEVPCQVPGFDGSGNADGLLLVGPDGQRICWEHKNVGGFAYKMMVGERGAPQGPKHSAKVQGALNALAMNADDLVITVMTWEAISIGIATKKGFSEEGRVAAQWTFPRSEWEPWALAEVERVTGILDLVDEGTLPARKIPDPELPAAAKIVDPATGRWEVRSDDDMIVDTGTFWACAYCDWQDTCKQTAAGRQPIDEVAVVLGLRQDAA